MTPKNAEILALEGLGWLAGEEEIERFLSLSGIDPAQLRQAAGDPGTLVAVLDFLLGDDALLVRFCEHAAISPKQLHLARRALGGEAE